MNWYSMRPGPEREAAKAASKRQPFDVEINRMPVNGESTWIGPSRTPHPYRDPDEEIIAKLGAKSGCPPLPRDRFRIERIGERLFIVGASGQRTYVPSASITPGLWRVTYQHVNEIEDESQQSASGQVATAETDQQQTGDKKELK